MTKKPSAAVAVVLVTASSLDEAMRIANHLLEERLCACVNVVKDVRSFYWWMARREKTREVLLVIKTTQDQVSAVTDRVKKIHSYQVPEVLALAVTGGNADYLKWVNEETEAPRGQRASKSRRPRPRLKSMSRSP